MTGSVDDADRIIIFFSVGCGFLFSLPVSALVDVPDCTVCDRLPLCKSQNGRNHVPDTLYDVNRYGAYATVSEGDVSKARQGTEPSLGRRRFRNPYGTFGLGRASVGWREDELQCQCTRKRCFVSVQNRDRMIQEAVEFQDENGDDEANVETKKRSWRYAVPSREARAKKSTRTSSQMEHMAFLICQ